MEVTISRDLEIPKDSIQTLKCQCAYMMSQVINYYKDVKSGHIIITTFVLHYCERWRCYMPVKIHIYFQNHYIT